jgi:hypothetical protein
MVLMGKRALGRQRREPVDNIKMDLRETGCGNMYWIELAEGSCEDGEEPSGSTKCWRAPRVLPNWRPLEKGHFHEVGVALTRDAAFTRRRAWLMSVARARCFAGNAVWQTVTSAPSIVT